MKIRRISRFSILIVVFLLHLSNSVFADDLTKLSKHELLKRYAPVIHSMVNTSSSYYEGQDLLVGVDHDKNWGTYDSEEHKSASDNWRRTTFASSISSCNPNRNDLTPIIYANMIELADQYILSYEFYHTYNEIEGPWGDHMNDIETVNVAVQKRDGYVKGITTIAHGSMLWAAQWASTSRPSIFHVYNKQTYKLWMDGNHPHVWVGLNGRADLAYMTHGHAVFPFYHRNMGSRGITYRVAEDDQPVSPTFVGSLKDNNSFTSNAKYLLVSSEELLIKNKSLDQLDNIYMIGQGGWRAGGQFWGNGWYGYAHEGNQGTTNVKHMRYRYNKSYGNNAMSTTTLFRPSEKIGVSHTNLHLASVGNLKAESYTPIFYRQSDLELQGSGSFGLTSQSQSDKLSMVKTESTEADFSIEAGVRRVGKLHLSSGFYSDPFNLGYLHGTGPTGGILVSNNFDTSSDFVYIAWAPENQKVVLMERLAHLNSGRVKVSYLDIPKFHRAFKLVREGAEIRVYAKDYRFSNSPWALCYSITSDVFNDKLFAALLTQSDVNSLHDYYWTNTEYSGIKLTGFDNPLSMKVLPVMKKKEIQDLNISELDLYPNPVTKDNLTIRFTSANKGNLAVKIFNRSGFLKHSSEKVVYKGVNRIPVNTSQLSSGFYFVNISMKNFNQTLKFKISK